MKRVLLVTILIILFTSFTATAQHVTSIIKLIATPEKYDGKRVLVHGYLHVQFEDQALYLSKHDADFLNGENAVWVTFPEDTKVDWTPEEAKQESYHRSFDCQYVLIEATFKSQSHGHMGMFAGKFVNVTRLEKQVPYSDGKNKLQH